MGLSPFSPSVPKSPSPHTEASMRRILWIVMIAALLIAAAVAGGYAASDSYQFVGTVIAAP